ncbi:hypothetical protein JXL83_09840 [candidate division WOR-3 bacterium]|nr:hypothetical protein [candidate division WOR-3 bacterium]
MIRKISCYFPVFLTACFSHGCVNPFSPLMAPPGGIDDPVNPDTPEKVLQNLTLSYRILDLDLYLSCLDSADFVFYFDPDDEGINQYLAALGIYQYQWGYEEEKTSTEAIFISMKETGESVVPVFIGSGVYYTDSFNAVIMREYTFDPPVIHGELVRGKVVFYLSKSGSVWKITAWRDMVNG